MASSADAIQNAIQNAIERWSAAWKTNDGAALAARFVEDGSLINPFGRLAAGREAIARMYGEYFGGMLEGTTARMTLESVREVGQDHAFVDAEQTVVGADGKPTLVIHLAALMRREGDDWLFVESRPYTFASPPR